MAITMTMTDYDYHYEYDYDYHYDYHHDYHYHRVHVQWFKGGAKVEGEYSTFLQNHGWRERVRPGGHGTDENGMATARVMARREVMIGEPTSGDVFSSSPATQ